MSSKKQAISAVTGRFVTLDYAAKHPKTTVVRTVEKPPKKK